MEKRYYYKTVDELGWLNLKSPSTDPNHIVISEEEWNAHMETIEGFQPTEEELKRKRAISQINEYKQLLRNSDYVVIKIAEAETEEEKATLRNEYAEIINQRKQWRVLINELEAQL